MRPIARRWLALVTASMGLYLVLPDRGLAQNTEKLVVPNGTYAFHVTGYIRDPYGSGTLVPLAAAGRVTFFANGTTSGVLTESINQIQSPVTINGTFTVNADGSASETEIQTSGPGLTLHFSDYPTPDGNTITFVGTDPGSILSGIDTR